MNNLKDILVDIKTTFGTNIFTKERQCRALIADFAPHLINERDMIVRLINYGILEELISGIEKSEKEKRRLLELCYLKLVDEKFIDAVKAREYLNLFSEIFEYDIHLTPNVGDHLVTVKDISSFEGKTLYLKNEHGETISAPVLNHEANFLIKNSGEWNLENSKGQSLDKTVEIKTRSSIKLDSSVYGIRIRREKTSTEVEYLYDAKGMNPVEVNKDTGAVNYNGWEKSWVFDHINPVMLKRDGTVDYLLNPNNYLIKAEGGFSSIFDPSYDGNAMAMIEKFYVSFRQEDKDSYYLISDKKRDGFFPLGFSGEKKELDYNFLPIFRGSFDAAARLRSLGGQEIATGFSYDSFYRSAQRNGSRYSLEPHTLITLYDILCLILGKSSSPSATFGRGRMVSDKKHTTGILNNKGPIAYDPKSGAVKFMHVEDYWTFNLSSLVDGCISDGKNIYVRWNAPYSATQSEKFEKVMSSAKGHGLLGAFINRGKEKKSFYNSKEFKSLRRSGNRGPWFRGFNDSSKIHPSLCAALSYEPE